MGDTNLHGVLRMPPDCWDDSELDKTQRHSRYIQASDLIYELREQLKQERQRIADEAIEFQKRAIEFEGSESERAMFNRALRDFADYLREDK